MVKVIQILYWIMQGAAYTACAIFFLWMFLSPLLAVGWYYKSINFILEKLTKEGKNVLSIVIGAGTILFVFLVIGLGIKELLFFIPDEWIINSWGGYYAEATEHPTPITFVIGFVFSWGLTVALIGIFREEKARRRKSQKLLKKMLEENSNLTPREKDKLTKKIKALKERICN